MSQWAVRCEAQGCGKALQPSAFTQHPFGGMHPQPKAGVCAVVSQEVLPFSNGAVFTQAGENQMLNWGQASGVLAFGTTLTLLSSQPSSYFRILIPKTGILTQLRLSLQVISSKHPVRVKAS